MRRRCLLRLAKEEETLLREKWLLANVVRLAQVDNEAVVLVGFLAAF